MRAALGVLAIAAVTLFVTFAVFAGQGVGNGSLTGRVLHADGSPAVAFAVGVFAAENAECVPAEHGVETVRGSFSALAAHTLTDGAGAYRLLNIPNGRYILAAGTASLPGQTGASPCFLAARYTDLIRQPMYLPGVGDKTKATVITVTAGAAAMPDLKLPPDPAPAGFKVSGRVMGSPVVRSGGILIVRLANNAFPPSNGPCRIIQTNVAPDGAFEFRNIPPCAYTATVNANYGDTGRGAFPGVDTSTRVDVVDKDITGIFLGPGGLGAVPAPTPVTVAPSGRPMLLETRLGMVPRPPLATAKDCGHVPKEPAQAVVSCVEAALGARAPFIASFEMKGIDSQIVTGLAGTPPDVVQVLFVQSSAGGAPKVSAPNDCPNPKLTVVSGSVQIACN